MPRVQWDAVIDDGADSFALDGKEKLALLSLLRAYEYTESLHLDLAEYLRTVSAQLNEDDQKACKKIPQRQLKDSYKKIEAMSTAIKTGKLM
jgi:hypothetical protein